MFCTNCGSTVEDGTKFCTHCGSPVNQANPAPISDPAYSLPPLAAVPYSSPVYAPPAGEDIYHAASSKPKRKPLLKRILLGGIAVLLFITIIAVIVNVAGGKANKLRLGNAVELGIQTIGSEGGVITVNAADSAIDGLTLTVPAGAYKGDLDYSIRETEITSHNFGELFTPITPLITIDNGHGFADTPMTLTIPIQLAEDEFAMAFFYDKKTETLEGIPATELTLSSLTLVTSHFSDVVITKVKKLMLQKAVMNKEADTNFMPGKDDFYAANYGSCVFPGGHCGGQSIAMMHYFTKHAVKADTGINLRTETAVDNNTYDATPLFWQDDSLAYRLCSVIHKEYDITWHAAFSNFLEGLDAHDDVTYYSFAYAIALSKSPQFVDLRGTDAKGAYHAHCMVVYGVTPDSLLICDPNFPGSLIRDVAVTQLSKPDSNGNTMNISDYNSGDYADSAAVVYDKISYIGTYALVNYSKVDALWQQVLDGKDVGAGIFQADPQFIAFKVDDTTKKPGVVKLGSNFSISSSETMVIEPAKPNCIYISVPKLTAGENYDFYNGTKPLYRYTSLGQDAKSWAVIPLNKGLNEIGIYFSVVSSLGDRYVNFYRFSIMLTDDATSSASSSSDSGTPTHGVSSSPVSPTVAATPTTAPASYDYSAALAAWMADFAAAANKTYDDNTSTDTYTLQWVNTPHIDGGTIIGAHVLWRHAVYKDGRAEQNYIEVYVYDAATPGNYLSLEELKAAYPQFQK